MNFLLDTHTLLWFLEGKPELSNVARMTIESPVNVKWVSVATLWEIAVKMNLGKLTLLKPFSELGRQLDINGFQLLSVEFSHTLTYCTLPLHHRDPFDRLLIAQAITENLTVLTRDPQFKLYPVPISW